MSVDPGYPPPAPAPGPPPVWWWYVGYCVLVVLFGLVVGATGLFGLLAPDSMAQQQAGMLEALGMDISPAQIAANSAMQVAMAAVWILAYSIAPFLPRTPRVWGVHAVLIAFSFTACCCVPAAIPLLVFWMKPETRAHFGC